MASGDTLLIISPLSYEPPGSNYATPDFRNFRPVLDFDPDTDESAMFTRICPRHYGAGGITVYLHTSYSSATSGNAIWTVEFELIGDEDQDLDSDGFATAKSLTAAAPSNSGDVTIDSVAFTNSEIDGITVGDAFRIRVARDANHGSDTASGDGELVAIELKET